MCINVNVMNTKVIENLSHIIKEIIKCKEEIKRLPKLARKSNENTFTYSLLPKLPLKCTEETDLLEEILKKDE